ncbi:hypothetical protein YB2330_003333 [Saitoella coloradoensis]
MLSTPTSNHTSADPYHDPGQPYNLTDPFAISKPHVFRSIAVRHLLGIQSPEYEELRQTATYWEVTRRLTGAWRLRRVLDSIGIDLIRQNLDNGKWSCTLCQDVQAFDKLLEEFQDATADFELNKDRAFTPFYQVYLMRRTERLEECSSRLAWVITAIVHKGHLKMGEEMWRGVGPDG